MKNIWIIFVRWPYEENENFEGVAETLEIAKAFCDKKVLTFDGGTRWKGSEDYCYLEINWVFGWFTLCRIEKVKFLEA
jgi:hypothetical protein